MTNELCKYIHIIYIWIYMSHFGARDSADILKFAEKS